MATFDGPWACENGAGQLANTKPLRATFYRRGAIVTGWDYDGPTGGGKRGKVTEFSDESRRRLSWSLDNAPEPWGATSLLTFAVQPKKPKAALEKFTRRVRIELPGMEYAWWMETQKRGVTHFHFLWLQSWLADRGWLDPSLDEHIGRGKRQRCVLRGPLDDFIRRAWCASVDHTSPKFERFQAGGTSERVRHHSKLAWYAASEAGKAHQKELPPGSEGEGRWWYITKGQRPVARGAVDLSTWTPDFRAKYIYDAEVLANCEWAKVDASSVDVLEDSEQLAEDGIPF